MCLGRGPPRNLLHQALSSALPMGETPEPWCTAWNHWSQANSQPRQDRSERTSSDYNTLLNMSKQFKICASAREFFVH